MMRLFMQCIYRCTSHPTIPSHRTIEGRCIWRGNIEGGPAPGPRGSRDWSNRQLPAAVQRSKHGIPDQEAQSLFINGKGGQKERKRSIEKRK